MGETFAILRKRFAEMPKTFRIGWLYAKGRVSRSKNLAKSDRSMARAGSPATAFVVGKSTAASET